MRTQFERSAFICATLKAQGFNSKLEQYTVIKELYQSDQSKVMLAKHKILDLKVVIKFIPVQNYEKKERLFFISEVDA